jgi:Undecaprenyl-phosphate galactose phosphotransferase WbaP
MDNDRTEQAPFSYTRRWVMNAACLLAGDSMVLAFALLMAGLIRYVLRDSHMPPSRGFFLIPAWCVGAVLLRLAPSWGVGAVEKLRRTQLLLITLFALAASAMFLSKSAGITSRIKFMGAYLLCVPLIPLVRTWITSILIECRLWGVPTVIYGTDRTVWHVLELISNEPGLGYIPYGYFEDEAEGPQDRIEGCAIQRLGKLRDYTAQAPFALLGAPSIPRGALQELMDGPLSHYRRVIILPDLLDIPSVWVTARDFNGVLGLELIRNLLNPLARLVKRLAETLLVILLAPLWLPLGIVVALLILAHDRANPFYRQKRIGRHGRPFMMLKFRTMVPRAEDVLNEALERDPELRREWETDHKLKDDPRITPLGHWLRRTSLDEIPQLLNVLRGQMALVGPRPLPDYHHSKMPHSVLILREQVAPGITGLWQVSGRSDAGTDGMEKLDSYYVRNWSFWLDAIILAKTCSAVWHGKGAY